MKTYTAKPHELEQTWHLIDASGQTLGRLAAEVANLLRGKHKPEYTPHIDTGDFVIIVNSEKIVVTGNKFTDKKYWRHSGYPGGFRQTSYKDVVSKDPTRVVEHAIKGMLPHNSLGRSQFLKCKIYVGPTHPHEAQQPIVYNLEASK